jgi:hypothetical protein
MTLDISPLGYTVLILFGIPGALFILLYALDALAGWFRRPKSRRRSPWR